MPGNGNLLLEVLLLVHWQPGIKRRNQGDPIWVLKRKEGRLLSASSCFQLQLQGIRGTGGGVLMANPDSAPSTHHLVLYLPFLGVGVAPYVCW